MVHVFSSNMTACRFVLLDAFLGFYFFRALERYPNDNGTIARNANCRHMPTLDSKPLFFHVKHAYS